MSTYPSGYAHSNRRVRTVTPEQVREIVRRYEAGETYAAIAKAVGCTASAVAWHVPLHTVLRRHRLPGNEIPRTASGQ